MSPLSGVMGVRGEEDEVGRQGVGRKGEGEMLGRGGFQGEGDVVPMVGSYLDR